MHHSLCQNEELGKPEAFKVEYHANENPLKKSEKIAYIGQRLMYPIIKNNNTLPL